MISVSQAHKLEHGPNDSENRYQEDHVFSCSIWRLGYSNTTARPPKIIAKANQSIVRMRDLELDEW